jgi:hypothetical protein
VHVHFLTVTRYNNFWLALYTFATAAVFLGTIYK